MIDVSNAQWELSKDEKYAINWFNRNGFNGKLEKQYVSKTVFQVEKDGIKDKFELPQGAKIYISEYMEQYRMSWEMLAMLKEGGTE